MSDGACHFFLNRAERRSQPLGNRGRTKFLKPAQNKNSSRTFRQLLERDNHALQTFLPHEHTLRSES